MSSAFSQFAPFNLEGVTLNKDPMWWKFEFCGKQHLIHVVRKVVYKKKIDGKGIYHFFVGDMEIPEEFRWCRNRFIGLMATGYTNSLGLRNYFYNPDQDVLGFFIPWNHEISESDSSDCDLPWGEKIKEENSEDEAYFDWWYSTQDIERQHYANEHFLRTGQERLPEQDHDITWTITETELYDADTESDGLIIID